MGRVGNATPRLDTVFLRRLAHHERLSGAKSFWLQYNTDRARSAAFGADGNPMQFFNPYYPATPAALYQ